MGDVSDKSNFDAGDDWTIPCSDDEIADPVNWEPSAAEIKELYDILDRKQILDIEWQCPGRRSPSVHTNESDTSERRSLDDSDAKKPCEPSDFEFEDEISKATTPKITPRRRLAPASTTKRVASLDKVMFDIERYRKLDELESQKISASPYLNKKTLASSASSTIEKTS